MFAHLLGGVKVPGFDLLLRFVDLREPVGRKQMIQVGSLHDKIVHQVLTDNFGHVFVDSRETRLARWRSASRYSFSLSWTWYISFNPYRL